MLASQWIIARVDWHTILASTTRKGAERAPFP